MLDMSWAGSHGDHSTVCDMCNMTDIWFKLAHMLLQTVFPEGVALPEEDVPSHVAYGGLFRSSASSNKGISNRSLSKSIECFLYIGAIFNSVSYVIQNFFFFVCVALFAL